VFHGWGGLKSETVANIRNREIRSAKKMGFLETGILKQQKRKNYLIFGVGGKRLFFLPPYFLLQNKY
jgi:hypothetical protein